MKKIAIEEHFWTEEIKDFFGSNSDTVGLLNKPDRVSKLLDLQEGRLRDMDESGIDMQVLCLASGLESFDALDATAMARKANDQLAGVIEKYPERFSGFATLAPQNPVGAAKELERAVKELGLRGAKINSHIRGEYLDDQKYWVIFEVAEKLGVPIHLHPRRPSPDMIKPYLAYPALAGAMWGFAAETGLHAMRLILSGVFDKYPGLKIILGHLGEALPFWLWRIDNHWLKEGVATDQIGKKLKNKPSQYIKDNFLVTTSGMCWQPALLCALMALGAERILFAVDYPHESNREAVEFMDSLQICDSDKEMIYHGNAEKFLLL